MIKVPSINWSLFICSLFFISTPSTYADDQANRIVVIDGSVKDYQTLLNQLPASTESVVLDTGKDGIVQLADYLKNRSNIDEIHFISHGRSGELQMGNTWLSNDNIQTKSGYLSRIGKSLSQRGDLLLYGCDLAKGKQGQEFVASIAKITGADVAASNNKTGATILGGDSVFETHLGLITTSSVIGADAWESFGDVLLQSFSSGTLPLTDSGTANFSFVQVGDFDGDGDADILTQEGGSGTAVTLWSNDGSGSFTSSETIATGVTGLNISFTSVRIADYDNDGDLDYFQRLSGAGNDLYYVNNGSGSFSAGTAPISDSGTTSQAFIQAFDVDNDGDVDILTRDGGAATATGCRRRWP